jgi:hypothetical protein
VIDDVDSLLTFGPGDDLSELTHALKGLERLIRWREVDGNLRVVLTSTVDFQGPTAGRLASAIEQASAKAYYINACSSVLTTSVSPYRLDPWKGDWQTAFSTRFYGAFAEYLGKTLQAWCKAILDASGGHPMLVGPVMKELCELCSNPNPGVTNSPSA